MHTPSQSLRKNERHRRRVLPAIDGARPTSLELPSLRHPRPLTIPTTMCEHCSNAHLCHSIDAVQDQPAAPQASKERTPLPPPRSPRLRRQPRGVPPSQCFPSPAAVLLLFNYISQVRAYSRPDSGCHRLPTTHPLTMPGNSHHMTMFGNPKKPANKPIMTHSHFQYREAESPKQKGEVGEIPKKTRDKEHEGSREKKK